MSPNRALIGDVKHVFLVMFDAEPDGGEEVHSCCVACYLSRLQNPKAREGGTSHREVPDLRISLTIGRRRHAKKIC